MDTQSGTHDRVGKGSWLADRPITAKLILISVVYVLIIGILILLLAAALEVSQGVRAYVGGEGLWSKGQKDAVYYLTRYVDTQDEREWQAYQRAISIPLGDRDARVEMLKSDYNYEVVEAGFVEGGNHPDDVPNMVILFRHFGTVTYLAEAIAIWTEADSHVAELQSIGDSIREVVLSGGLTPPRRTQYFNQIEAVNSAVTPLEHRFSAVLAEGARWIPEALLLFISTLSILLLSVSIWISWRISRQLHAGIFGLKRAAVRVADGDLNTRVTVASRDELGDLAAAFNEMIVHRREAGVELEQERQFLSAVLDNINDGVVACDHTGMLSVFNRATQQMHGLPAEPLPPEEWADHYDLFRADGITRMDKEEVPLYRAFEGEKVRNEQMVIAPKGLAPRQIIVSGQQIISHEGRKLGAVCTLHDITDRRRAERELLARAQELERSNTELRRFAYVASHDLQGPLRTVASFSQMLASRYQGQLDEEADEFIGYITSAAASMSDMIHGLLAYSRINQEASFEETDLNTLLEKARDNLRSDIAASKAQIQHSPLPRVYVNPQQIVQLLQNLLQNAIKFRTDNRIEISVDAERYDGEWIISVRDNGIGIDPASTDEIFEIFKRLHTEDRFPGSGIGLALCKQIITQHHGRIWAEPGNPGTVIRFTLPAIDSDSPAESA